MRLKSKWIEFIYKSATSTRKIRTLLTPVGAIVFGLFLGLFITAAIFTDYIFHISWIFPFFWISVIAVILIVSGLFFTSWSVYHFIKVKGTPVPVNPPPILVISGPYKYMRNPMLTGIFLLLFGIGLVIKSTSLVVIFTPLFILLNVLELKLIEEPELAMRLGEEYVNYKRVTPMFFPKFKQFFSP